MSIARKVTEKLKALSLCPAVTLIGWIGAAYNHSTIPGYSGAAGLNSPQSDQSIASCPDERLASAAVMVTCARDQSAVSRHAIGIAMRVIQINKAQTIIFRGLGLDRFRRPHCNNRNSEQAHTK